MPSTYTANNGIEKIGIGEQSETWGDTTNLNLDFIDTSLDGAVTLTLSASTYNLSMVDGVTSDARNRILLLGGTPPAPVTVTVLPNDMEKYYFVVNSSGQTVTFAQGASPGATVAIADGDTAMIRCEGAGVGSDVVVVDLASQHINSADPHPQYAELSVDETVTGAWDFTQNVYFESRKHAISWNETTGDFNLRVGHTEQTDVETTTEAGYPMKMGWTQSTGLWELQVSSASLAVDDPITWRTQITANPDAVSLGYQGSTKLATVSAGVDITGDIGVSNSVIVGNDLTVGDDLFMAGATPFISFTNFGGILRDTYGGAFVGQDGLLPVNGSGAAANGGYALGSTTYRWNGLYATTVNTSSVMSQAGKTVLDTDHSSATTGVHGVTGTVLGTEDYHNTGASKIMGARSSVTNADYNTLMGAGCYRLSTNTTNGPGGNPAYNTLLTLRGPGADTAAQIAFAYTESKMWFRSDNGASDSNWSVTNPWKTVATLEGTQSFSGDLDPSATGTYDLGNSGRYWKHLYVDAISSSGDSYLGNLFPNSSLVHDLGSSSVRWDFIYADDINLRGSINGAQAVGTYFVVEKNYAGTGCGIGFSASFQAVPRKAGALSNNTVDLGSSTYRWKTLYYYGLSQGSGRDLKTAITPMPSMLQKIKALQPVTYRYKVEEEMAPGQAPTRYGLIAEDTEVVFGVNKSLVKRERPNQEEIEAGATDSEQLSMDYTQLIAPLIKAVQELAKKVEDLEAQLAALQP